MFRCSPALAVLAHRLLTGSVVTTAVLATAALSVACKNENEPEYWLDKVKDPQWQGKSVKRLEQFFDDAYGRNNSDLTAPAVQALVDKLAEPLTTIYVENYDTLATKTRVDLIRLLSTFRDKRTEPALRKAFEEFAKKPSTNRDDADIKWAANAAADLKLPSLAGPMGAAFDKLRTSSMLGGITYQDFNRAMVDLKDPSWVGLLTQKLEAPMPKVSADDKTSVDQFKDQLFWQTTAAEVLGNIGDAQAVTPLLRVMLDPSKVDVQRTAVLALVKLGKPAVEATLKLLKGQDSELVAYSSSRQKEVAGAQASANQHVRIAAIVLGTIGRAEARPALIEALKAESDDVTRAILARELAKLPGSAESLQAFRAAFESIPADTVVPPGAGALLLLTESAGQFYDPSLVEWLLGRADAAKGEADEKAALQGAIVVTALKLAKPDQLPAVKKAVDRYGSPIEKGLYEQADKILTACGDRVGCYLTAIEKAENQERAGQFIGIKAGYMIGILGNDQTRGELIERLDTIENAAVRFIAAQAIDRLSPQGSKDAAADLKKIIEKNAKSPDKNKQLGDAPLKEVMYRIEARVD